MNEQEQIIILMQSIINTVYIVIMIGWLYKGSDQYCHINTVEQLIFMGWTLIYFNKQNFFVS